MSKASQLRQKAQDHLKKGRLEKAIEEYTRLVQLESRNPNVYNELGDIYLKAGDRIQAVSSFEKASSHYEKVALYNNAIAVCKKILRVVPNRLDTIFKLGELKAKQKFTGEAVNFFLQYMNGVLNEPQPAQPGLQERIDLMLELAGDNEDLTATAAELLGQGGRNREAAELLAGLVSRIRAGGDRDRATIYLERLAMLKNTLGQEDRAHVESLIASEADQRPPAGEKPIAGDGVPVHGEPGAVKLPDDATVAAETDAGKVPEASSPVPEPGVTEIPDAASPFDEPAAQAAPAGETAPGEPAATGGETATCEPVAPAGDALSNDPASPAGNAAPAGETAPGESRTGEIPVAAAEPEAAAPNGKVYDIAVDPPERAASLDDIFDEADDAPARPTGTESLAEEITSDVEEDDFRSHYDLGMAYLEMALYNEAIKEYQIASRSEHLQASCFEMIGHCFILLDNPRLAVKQLERGLAEAIRCGGDTLGIHYNLGLAREMLGELERAREHFEEVYIVDVTFRDVAEKMKKLSTIS
ncbi:MAG: tetratricopeptide repeat protein [Candidatus Krumholzibacteriota bacterium]|nr:tetratricopeptide repeat protein [Candidatus Krumholzibacteriota bacterium]